MEFASVVIWRTYLSVPSLPGNKQIELAVRQVFVPTALMISSFLVLLASVLLTIDIHKTSKATGKNAKMPKQKHWSYSKIRLLHVALIKQ